ncbi:hypothetical protein HDU85_002709, partial [Gaertneriomyces sp. JEL0708]
MDCDRSIVVFNYGSLFSPRVTMNAFNVQRFNVTQQCEESLVAFGLNSYAVMDSPTRMTYFTVTSSGVSSSSSRPYVPTSSTRPANSSSTGTSRPNVPTSSNRPSFSSSSAAPSGPSFAPSGSTGYYGPITSATGNWTGAVWINANNTVTTINTKNGQTYTVNLNTKTPPGSRPVVPGRIRAVYHNHAGNVMFVEDRANQWIALYGLDEQLQVYATMNVTGFRTFEVSQTGQYVAAAYSSPGMKYIQYIDMYDTFAK